MRLHGAEACLERQRSREPRALEGESRLGRDAARELEAGLDVAVTAALEYDHLGHDRILEEAL